MEWTVADRPTIVTAERRFVSPRRTAFSPSRPPGYGTGLVLIGFGAVFFSLITTCSKFAYQAGATPLALVWIRFAAFVLLVGAVQAASRRGFRLPRRNLIATLPMSVGMMMMSVGYLSAVVYIKVSLAVVLLYSFPLMVGILAGFSGRERIRPGKAAALLMAFLGLALAVGLESGGVDWRGVAFALVAALGVAGTMTFGGPYLEGVDTFAVNIWTNLWMLIAMTLYLALFGGATLPEGTGGWIGLGGATLCYILGFVLLFAAMKRLPPSQTAVMMYIEPIVSITAATLLLGETTRPLQWLGVAIMLSALCFSALAGAKRQA
ncbi:MAG TPA: DMT family transporter [Candidatus Cybelea sp.]|nr:DMT family transporter [Candidatus Cybelea sp.]